MKLKLGIVLGMLVILAACQKEEVTVADAAPETTSSKMYQEAPVDQEPNVFTPAPTVAIKDVAPETTSSKMYQEVPVDQGPNIFTPAPTNEDDNDKPQTPLSPNNVYDDERTDDNEGFSPEVWPPNDITDVSSDLNRKERSIKITWTDESPTDEKWIFINTKGVSSDQNANSIDTACSFEDCDTAIPAAQAYYQNLADQLCQDMYVCVTCCQRDRTLYARIIIKHNCGIMPPPEGF